MAAHTVCKLSHEGVGYSVVELNDVRHVFAAAVPRRGETLESQARDAMETIAQVVSEQGVRGSIVHQAVFVRDIELIEPCRELIRQFYGPDLPATSYVAQPPCNGKLLAIEALGVGRGFGDVEIQRLSEQLVVARHNQIAWVHAAQAVPEDPSASAYDQAISAFSRLRHLLHSAGVRLDQVVRTWVYVGGIVDQEGPTQRYMELNRARSDFYEGVPFLKDLLLDGRRGTVYPASTGIGTLGRGISLSAIALATERADIVAVPLENPRQTSAYEYCARYGPKSPKFSRAMAISCGRYTTIFVSGTASITQSETRHIGDVAAQTHETLNNIQALIAEDNLAAHGLPGLGTTLDGLALVRVYIKRQHDYPTVRKVCQERLGELPTIFAVGDVCRPELLVEIEGIAFSQRTAGPLEDGHGPHIGRSTTPQLVAPRWGNSAV